jgi:hypothetical protein
MCAKIEVESLKPGANAIKLLRFGVISGCI